MVFCCGWRWWLDVGFTHSSHSGLLVSSGRARGNVDGALISRAGIEQNNASLLFSVTHVPSISYRAVVPLFDFSPGPLRRNWFYFIRRPIFIDSFTVICVLFTVTVLWNCATLFVQHFDDFGEDFTICLMMLLRNVDFDWTEDWKLVILWAWTGSVESEEVAAEVGAGQSIEDGIHF